MKTNLQILKYMKFFMLVLMTVLQTNCSSSGGDTPAPAPNPTPVVTISDVDFWLTKGNKSVLLQKQSTILSFATAYSLAETITVSEGTTFQTMDGFGYTLTGGSAQMINQLSPTKKAEILQELFGSGTNSLGISYLRISIGASDLNSSAFTYNDGVVDTALNNFSLLNDAGVILLLKQILLINPAIKIVATPWSAPAWMKTNNSLIGGSLQAQYYGVYSRYFVKYIQAMQAEGITINAITPQNEPENPTNNPSMLMTAIEQNNFIKNNLGPAFQTAGINTKIICFDHNCDNTGYATTILSDAQTNPYVDGSAFHLYAGDISALTTIHNAFPTKNVYFTEQYTAKGASFGNDLKWHFRNVLIGATNNWSKNVLEWNLANNADSQPGPFTQGGCNTCLGALTINGDDVERNVSYYIIAHASKFVPTGSVRIGSGISGNMNNDLNFVAFKTPAGKKVLIVLNDGSAGKSFKISFNNKWVIASLDAGSVGTFVW